MKSYSLLPVSLLPLKLEGKISHMCVNDCLFLNSRLAWWTIDPQNCELHSYLNFFCIFQNSVAKKYLKILMYFLCSDALWITKMHLNYLCGKWRGIGSSPLLQGAVCWGIFMAVIFRGEHAPSLLLSFVLELQWIHCVPSEGTAELLFDVQPGNLYLWVLKDGKTELMLQMLTYLLPSTALGREEE